MHWPVEKKLFGKSLNLDYLATRNVFLLLNKFGTIPSWNIWQQEMFFLLLSKFGTITSWNIWQQNMLFLLVSKSRTITGMFGNKKCFFAEQVLNNNKRDLN